MAFDEKPRICGTGMLAARQAGMESGYREALRAWSRGQRDDAARRFDALLFLRRDAEAQALVDRVRAHHAAAGYRYSTEP